MDWVRRAVGDCRLDQCECPVIVAVFRWLDILSAMEVSNFAFGSDRGRFVDFPGWSRALDLARLTTLWTVCRVPRKFWAGGNGRQQQRYEPAFQLGCYPGFQPGRVAEISAAG